MPRAVVVAFDPADAGSVCDRIRRAGFEADICPSRGTAGLRSLAESLPDLVVIDLIRMPSYGRWMGGLLRQRKATRAIPLLFIEGDPAKTRLVRKFLPDAVFTSLPEVGESIWRAIRNAPAEPVAPDVTRVPIASKLGIKPASVVALLNAPGGIDLKPLPRGAKLSETCDDRSSVVLLFVRSSIELTRQLPAAARAAPGAKLWAVWPKKSSGVPGDLTAPRIFEIAETLGFAAHKICAVDRTWSALGIARKRRTRR